MLDERYGNSRKRGIDKRIGWSVAGIFVILGLTVVLFGGWQNASQIEFKVIDYRVDSDTTVTVSAQVSAPDQSQVNCAFEALSPSYAVVGWKVIELAPSQDYTRTVSTTLITTSPATTATVRTCWISENTD